MSIWDFTLAINTLQSHSLNCGQIIGKIYQWFSLGSIVKILEIKVAPDKISYPLSLKKQNSIMSKLSKHLRNYVAAAVVNPTYQKVNCLKGMHPKTVLDCVLEWMVMLIHVALY